MELGSEWSIYKKLFSFLLSTFWRGFLDIKK